MAKSKSKTKKVIDDEDEIPEEVEAEDVDSDADVDPEDAPIDADDEPPVDDDDGGADDAADDDEEGDIALPPGPPPPRITKMAMAFILLNWVAAPAFLYVAYQDHVERTNYSYRTLLNHAQVWGLPLKGEEDTPSLSNKTRPVQRFTPEQLKKAFGSRPKVTSIGSDPFVAVEEEVPIHLRPSDMTEGLLKDLFWDLSDPRKTLEDEVERVSKKVPEAISAATAEVTDFIAKMKEDDKRKFAEKNLAMPGDPDAQKKYRDMIANAKPGELDDIVKRAVIQKALFPLAPDVQLVKTLDDRVNAARGADLDKLVEESVQRRLYYDILAPLNVFRPADLGAAAAKKFRVERIADIQVFSLKEIEDHLQKRLVGATADKFDETLHLGDVFKTAAASLYNKDEGLPTGALVAEWRGSEDLEGYGPISFEIYQGGKAGLVDRDGFGSGDWKKSGANITLTFVTVIPRAGKDERKTTTYTGTISDKSISGKGQSAGKPEFTWSTNLFRAYGPEILTERDSVEKRKVIGFLLFTLGQVQKPIVGKKLFDKGAERASVVSGLHEFTSASVEYVRALRILESRVSMGAQIERQGWIITVKTKDGNEMTRSPGHIDVYEQEVDRLVNIVDNIDVAEKRLADLTKQQVHFQQMFVERTEQYKKAVDRLLDARKRTEVHAQELREKQLQLHEALKELSDAGERNFEIVMQIETIERGILRMQEQKSKKGGKK